MIEYTDTFLKEAKRLSKKFKHIKQDLKTAAKEITEQQDLGVHLGNNLYKKRVKNSSIPTGKSGGFRVIIYLQMADRTVFLTMYSKTEQSTITIHSLSR